MKITEEWVNVSHSIGAPFGGIGTGYGVLGKFGFVLPNFNSTPCVGKYDRFFELPNYDYLDLQYNVDIKDHEIDEFYTYLKNLNEKTDRTEIEDRLLDVAVLQLKNLLSKQEE